MKCLDCEHLATADHGYAARCRYKGLNQWLCPLRLHETKGSSECPAEAEKRMAEEASAIAAGVA